MLYSALHIIQAYNEPGKCKLVQLFLSLRITQMNSVSKEVVQFL